MRRPRYRCSDCEHWHGEGSWKYIILDSEDEIAVLYDEVIMKIEQFIKEGYFPKEYLV